MAKIRADLVGVVYPHSVDGIPLGVALAAGDTVPKGAIVGTHLLEAAAVEQTPPPEAPPAGSQDEPPAGTPLTPEELADAERQAAAVEQTPTPPSNAQPRGNASRDEWAAYATALGIEVPEGAKQKDIRDLVAAAQD